MGILRDQQNRKIEYIRLSLTDACNLACSYCREKGKKQATTGRQLEYDQLLMIVKVLTGLGITKFKITGGEPFCRQDAIEFIEQLKRTAGVEQVTLTTNGVYLEPYLPRLDKLGIDGINISLDSLKPDRYRQITGFDQLDTVRSAIQKTVAYGIKTKLNIVVMKGINDDEIIDFANLAKQYRLDVRFIELMPIGRGKNYQRFEPERILERLSQAFGDFYPLDQAKGNGPAVYYRNRQLQGDIGFINPVSHSFCADCNRIRLNQDGFLQLCLAEGGGIYLHPFLHSEAELQAKLAEIIITKPEQHHFQNRTDYQAREMWQIGG